MPATFHDIPVRQIAIYRDVRQRRAIDTDGLLESMRERGLIQPIVVRKRHTSDPKGDEPYVLVAGERRYSSALQLQWPTIQSKFYEELDPDEAEIIELEENVKRKALPWQDEVRAIGKLHHRFLRQNSRWTEQQTCAQLGISYYMLSRRLRVYEDLSDPKISGQTSLEAAFNMLQRKDHRVASDAVSELIEAGEAVEMNHPLKIIQQPTQVHGPTEAPILAPVIQKIRPKDNILPAEESILHRDFLEWAPSYSGPRFNFVHCDFPYGINVFAGKMSGRDRHVRTYNDGEEIYWALLKCLCDNLDRLVAPSAHLMFWFSMNTYSKTLATLREWSPEWHVNPVPIIWVKSDNVGIAADARRSPRNIYETCFIASRGDRHLVKAKSNAYSAPTDKTHHPSTKPEPMLYYFMEMFVDDGTRLLDPTCGSGAALRAAERLGAKHVLGLELDDDHCANARSALRNFRVLRQSAAPRKAS